MSWLQLRTCRLHFAHSTIFSVDTMASDQRPPIDKEKLKEKFDISHFDLNAVIRGIQLTGVGGMFTSQLPLAMPDTDAESQPIERFRTQTSSPRNTTGRRPLQSLRVLRSGF